MPRRRAEANAWGSYTQTAKHSRSLPIQHVSSSSSSSFIPSFVKSSTTSTPPAALIPKSSSEWSQHFDPKVVERFHESSSQDPTTYQEEEAMDLSPEIQCLIREIFAVYFNDGRACTSKKTSTFASRLAMMNGTMSWLPDFIDEKVRIKPLRMVLQGTQHCLRGIGQVYFQNSPLTGLFILIGLYVQSTRIATQGVIAIVCGNATAYAVGFDLELIKFGLFGYNAILVGLALATYDDERNYSASTMLITILAAALSCVIFVALGKLLVPVKAPPLTLPFNMAALLCLLATANMTRVAIGPPREPSLPDYENDSNGGSTIDVAGFFAGTVRGIGQVFLADNLATGVIMLIGIAICSRISAIAALLGSALGAGIALALGTSSITSVEDGIFGFNASLSVVTMVMFYVPSLFGAGMACFAGIATVVAQHALHTFLQPYGMPVMTLPFCMVGLAFIVIHGTTDKVVSVPLETMTTPEDHLARVRMLSDAVRFLKEAIDSKSKNESKDLGGSAMGYLQSLKRATTVKDKETTGGGSSLAKKLHLRKEHKHSEAWVDDAAKRVFKAITKNESDYIQLMDFQLALKASGMTDRSGLEFSGLLFTLLESERERNCMDLSNFIAFAVVSRLLLGIRRKVTRFLEFVDVDQDSFISSDDITSALKYLGEAKLSKEDFELLRQLYGASDDDEVVSYHVEMLADSIAAALVTNLISTYQASLLGDPASFADDTADTAMDPANVLSP